MKCKRKNYKIIVYLGTKLYYSVHIVQLHIVQLHMPHNFQAKCVPHSINIHSKNIIFYIIESQPFDIHGITNDTMLYSIFWNFCFLSFSFVRWFIHLIPGRLLFIYSINCNDLFNVSKSSLCSNARFPVSVKLTFFPRKKYECIWNK